VDRLLHSTYTFPLFEREARIGRNILALRGDLCGGFLFIKLKLPETKARRSNKLKGVGGLNLSNPMNRINLLQPSCATRIAKARTGRQRPFEAGINVQVRVEDLVIPTYLPAVPDKNPMFWRNAFIRAAAQGVPVLHGPHRGKPVDRKWKAVWIENEFIRRWCCRKSAPHPRVADKTNGYDLIYNQPVIKPRSWASPAVDFRWIEFNCRSIIGRNLSAVDSKSKNTRRLEDHLVQRSRSNGAHERHARHLSDPGRAYLELKVRAYNARIRANLSLWANVATRFTEPIRVFSADVY